jgi:Holliday junction resolvasome RuvABC endonuclease subunit
MLSKLSDIGRPKSFIGIDASTNSLAFSVFDDERLVRYGKINFTGTDAFYKAGDACKKSLPFFREVVADAIVIEGTIYSNSPKTAMQLSLVQGAIISAAQVSGIPIIKAVAPIQWQTYIGTGLLTPKQKAAIVAEYPGHTRSWYKAKQRETRKKMTIDSVNNKYLLSLTDNDITDAIGIGWYAAENQKLIFNG